jgi:hypothetical protein
MASVPLDLAPTPGFCVKSSAAPGETKVFVNICYDAHVPPPPPADDAAIRRAMNVQDDDDDDGNYYVPVVVSPPRQDRDKGQRHLLAKQRFLLSDPFGRLKLFALPYIMAITQVLS